MAKYPIIERDDKDRIVYHKPEKDEDWETFSYDDNNNVTRYNNQQGKWWAKAFDERSNQIFFANKTYQSDYTFDDDDNLTNYENDRGYWYTQKFDKNKNRIEFIDKHGKWEKCTWNKDSELTSYEDEHGNYWTIEGGSPFPFIVHVLEKTIV